MADKTIRVRPSPSLLPTEYVPGVGADGTDLPAKQAEALLEAGLVVRVKPKPEPVTPAKKPED